MLGIGNLKCRKLVFPIYITILIGLFFATLFGPTVLKWADHRLLGYVLTDIYARARGAESWSRAAKLPVNASYAWAQPDESGHLRIAHALGAWKNQEDRNTLRALHRSLNADFNLLEVDLSLGPDGGLYCYHGVSGQGARPSAIPTAEVCRYEDLIQELQKKSFFLILDLKDGFAQSAYEIAQRTPIALRNRIVFQLYQPDDLRIFRSLPVGFAGPIVTLYRSRRTVYHLGPALNSIGARVVTIPIERVLEFQQFSHQNRHIMLAHPVEDNRALSKLNVFGISGGYMDAIRK